MHGPERVVPVCLPAGFNNRGLLPKQKPTAKAYIKPTALQGLYLL